MAKAWAQHAKASRALRWIALFRAGAASYKFFTVQRFFEHAQKKAQTPTNTNSTVRPEANSPMTVPCGSISQKLSTTLHSLSDIYQHLSAGKHILLDCLVTWFVFTFLPEPVAGEEHPIDEVVQNGLHHEPLGPRDPGWTWRCHVNQLPATLVKNTIVCSDFINKLQHMFVVI